MYLSTFNPFDKTLFVYGFWSLLSIGLQLEYKFNDYSYMERQ